MSSQNLNALKNENDELERLLLREYELLEMSREERASRERSNWNSPYIMGNENSNFKFLSQATKNDQGGFVRMGIRKVLQKSILSFKPLSSPSLLLCL